MYVNLLPAKLQQRLLFRRRIVQWSCVWATCAVVAIAYCGLHYRTLRAQHRSHEEQHLACQPVRAVVDDTQALEQSLAAALARQAELRRLLPDDGALAVLAHVAEATRHARGQMRVEHLHFVEPEQLAPKSTTTPAPVALHQNRGSVTLQGVADDDDAVALFVDALRRAETIRRVELKSSSQHVLAGRDGRRFEIVCTF